MLGPVGVRAGALADDDVIEVDVLLDGAGGANPDDVLHAEHGEQLVGVDADGGHAHAGGHDGDLHALIKACVAVDAPDIIHQDGIFQEVFGDKLGAQRIAGHQNGLAEADLILDIDMGSGGEVGHNKFSFSV